MTQPYLLLSTLFVLLIEGLASQLLIDRIKGCIYGMSFFISMMLSWLMIIGHLLGDAIGLGIASLCSIIVIFIFIHSFCISIPRTMCLLLCWRRSNLLLHSQR